MKNLNGTRVVCPPLAALMLPSLLACCGNNSRVSEDRPASAGPVSVSDPTIYELTTDEAEILSISEGVSGAQVYVVSPGFSCGGTGEPSFLAILGPAGRDFGTLEESRSVPLGLGETTSVAAHPHGKLAFVAAKDPKRPNLDPGRLLAVEGDRIAGSISVGPCPDSVAVTPDGQFAVLACEGDVPDPEDCPAEASGDSPGSIYIVQVGSDPGDMKVAAIVTAEEMFRRHFKDEPHRAASPLEIEPEFVAIAPDSSCALVTLQEQSAVAVLDLGTVRRAQRSQARASQEAVGARCLMDVILLPHELVDKEGQVRGAHPDGIAISPDGSLAMTANEAHSKARELQGVSILDLRGAPSRVRLVATHSVFDLDPTLNPPHGSTKKKIVKNRNKPLKPRGTLPRLDPEGVAIGSLGSSMLAALAIERSTKQEEAGSVLFLDMTGALEGRRPRKIDRKMVGANEGARPEGLQFSRDSRYLLVASERDGGTITVLEIAGVKTPAALPRGSRP